MITLRARHVFDHMHFTCYSGRLMKGRFFVYQNVSGQVIIFIPPEFSADMVLVSADEPLKAQGQVLQVSCGTVS